MSHKDLDELIDRANNMLDGMAVNRDKFARDFVAAVKELRQWREAHARTEPVRQTTGKYGDFFKEMF